MITYAAGEKTCPAADQAGLSDATIEHIAHTMLDMAASGIVVDKEKLALYGDFTTAEIAAHWEAAADRARVLGRERRQ